MVYGYAGKILRLDLKNKVAHDQELTPEEAYDWLGGTGLGVKIVTQEVPAEARWNDPENKLVLAGGMLSGTSRMGSGCISVVTKGACTGGMTQSQANGTFGAFIKRCGYDAVVFEDQSDEWLYIYIDDNGVQFLNADFLRGLDTTETQHALHKKHGTNRYLMSVYCIGPAGENLCRFAMFTGDYGHVAGHNGSGAVLGAKKVKAICVRKGAKTWPVTDKAGLIEAAKKMTISSSQPGPGKDTAEFGTLVGYPGSAKVGVVPTKNGTTTIWEVEVDPRVTRGNLYDVKRTPCYGCPWTHCIDIKLKDERFKDLEAFEEPEFELAGLFTAGIGNEDIPYAFYLSNVADRVGLDGNELGWMCGWVVECFEKGYFTPEMFDNKIDLHWGDAEGVLKLINIITNREGKMGNILAEGIKRAAERLGPPAMDCAVYTQKGNATRGHDHRTLIMAHEYLDCITSSSGTIEVVGGMLNAKEHGIEPMSIPDRTDPFILGRHNAAIAGRRVVEDSIGACRFFTSCLDDVREAMTAASGKDYNYDEFMRIGKKIMAAARLYNISSGITYRVELPSKRYGAPQPDGPFASAHLGGTIAEARSNFFEFMGYDRLTGIPTPARLEELGLSEYIPLALKQLEKEYNTACVWAQYPDYCRAYGFGALDFETDAAKVTTHEVKHFDGFTNFFDRPHPEPKAEEKQPQ